MGTSDIEVEPVKLVTDSPEATVRMGAKFARMLQPNDVVGLQGTLGAGKTCFVKGMAMGLGVEDLRAVTSPTFVLLREYHGELTLYHFDAYRLEDHHEMEKIGCYEIFESGGISVVEWANHVSQVLPPDHFLVTIRMAGQTRRDFLLTACGPGPLRRLRGIFAALEEWEE